MKKSIYLLGMAVAALSSCSQSDVVEMPESRAIGFYGTGVNNSVRADITAATFNQFYVYGSYDNKPAIFNGQEVNKSNDNWTYNPIRYWVAGTYNFGAYAPKATGITASWNHTGGLTLEVNSDNNNQNDLVYAAQTGITVEEADLEEGSSVNPVSLQFKHLLSKLQFKFTKDAESLGALTVKMSNFKVEGLTTNAKWVAGIQGNATSVTTGDYTDLATAGTIDGTTGLATKQFYVIPQNVQAFNITANVTATDAAGTTIKNGTISATVPTTGITSWIAQNVYVYNAELSIENIDDGETPEPKPIVFVGNAEDWEETPNEGELVKP